MPIEITMPALSPTMTDGTLAKWLKAEGDDIEPGEAIAEIETDKATMEVEAVDEGRLARILVPAGSENVAVNQPIALLLLPGEDDSVLAATAPQPGAADGGAREKPAPTPAPAPDATTTTVRAEAAPESSGADGRVFASPLARRLAEQHGLDLAALAGTGPHGRIVKADIDAALRSGTLRHPEPTRPAPAERPVAAAPPPAPVKPIATGMDARALADTLGLSYRSEPHSSVRRTIARRLTEAKQTIPHFYLTIDCTLDALLQTRGELNRHLGDEARLTVNDFIIRAAALALVKVPAANAAWTEDAALYFDHADIAVAVATPAGLITPVIRHAESKGLASLGAEMRALADRARAGKLRPEEYQGGTFSISNLGMYGIRSFAAVINPPQACLLAVGQGEPRPVVRDGALAVATVMTCTLSVDHRIVDGAVGAEFLAAFKGFLEHPLTMLL